MRQQNVIQSHIYIDSSKNTEETLEDKQLTKTKTSQSKMKSHGQNIKEYNAIAN